MIKWMSVHVHTHEHVVHNGVNEWIVYYFVD